MNSKMRLLVLLGLAFISSTSLVLHAEVAPAAQDQSHPTTIHVSKLGDDTDGSSWGKAFRTIQKALDMVPDARGGHRIIVRPDTYMEANLYPAHRGASGAYNELLGDWDGRLGSGAIGWVVIDSGDANLGFKSYDWWGNIRAYKKGWSKDHRDESFSSADWDRWAIRRLYATGGDAGLFFDLVDKAEPFSVLVEDCFSVGRAFGGGAANILAREDEPSIFRRCQLWCLDWWGDAAGAYVRAEHEGLPKTPDVVFEDCTLVGPDNALQAGNPGYAGYTRVRLANCRLVSLNFSQPQGKPGSGVIFSTIEGKFLHVDLEDCTLMGCKIFGAGKGEVSYTTKGDVKAYVQFQQEVPKGMFRLDHWPVEVFQTLLPAPPERRSKLRIDEPQSGQICEVAPVVWQNRLALMKCNRPATGGSKDDYFLTLEDFKQKIQHGEFVEWEMVYEGKYYGTLKKELQGIWDAGKTPLLDIEVKGAIHIREQYPESTLSLFIEPPSVDELRRRLEGRGTETPESLMARVNKASYEISFKHHFDKIIVNDHLEKACREADEAVIAFLGL